MQDDYQPGHTVSDAIRESLATLFNALIFFVEHIVLSALFLGGDFVLKALVGIVLGTDSRFYTVVAVLLDTFVAVAALLIALMGAIGAVMTVFHGTRSYVNRLKGSHRDGQEQ